MSCSTCILDSIMENVYSHLRCNRFKSEHDTFCYARISASFNTSLKNISCTPVNFHIDHLLYLLLLLLLLLMLHFKFRRVDSTVGRGIGYRLDGRVLIPQRAIIFSLLHSVPTGIWSSPCPLSKWFQTIFPRPMAAEA
jgi:hypothetical protein